MAMIEKYRGLALLLAGGLSATGFAPLNWWPLTFLCLALLMHLVAQAKSAKRALLLGWLFGIGHFFVGIYWIAAAFRFQNEMPLWLGNVAVFGLALYLAVYPALAAWGAWRLVKFVAPAKAGAASGAAQPKQDEPIAPPASAGATLPFTLAFAGCWIVAEWLRSWVFTGFAWNPLAMVWIDTLWAGIALPFIGTYGFSGAIILAVGLLETSARGLWRNIAGGVLRNSGSWVAIGFAMIFIVPVLAVSLFPGRLLPEPKGEKSQTAIFLTIVQPNISQADKYKPGYEIANFAKLAAYSRPLTAQDPRLLFWPEAAIPWQLEDGYPNRYYQFQPGESAKATRSALASLMGRGDILLTGADLLEFGTHQQLIGARAAIVAMGSDAALHGRYAKAHLVPGGEYLPLRWLLEPIGLSRLVPGDIDFWPGPGPQTLTFKLGGQPVKIGFQLCYEIIFSGQVTDRANRPQFIVNPSNDAWYGYWQPPQHLAQARLRAIEEGLPVIRSTPTGISAVVDADGHIVKSLPQGQAGRIDAQLPTAKPPTLFALYGNSLPLAFAGLLIAIALLPLARQRFSR